MKFGYQSDDIRHVFENMSANDLIETIILKWIGKDAEVMNDIRMTPRIGIDTDCPNNLVLATTHIEYRLRRSGRARLRGFDHVD
jgi:hypothetical protein